MLSTKNVKGKENLIGAAGLSSLKNSKEVLADKCNVLKEKCKCCKEEVE